MEKIIANLQCFPIAELILPPYPPSILKCSLSYPRSFLRFWNRMRSLLHFCNVSLLIKIKLFKIKAPSWVFDLVLNKNLAIW